MKISRSRARRKRKSLPSIILSFFAMVFGAMLAAFAIQSFFIPNNLIDGGIVGVAMIGAHLAGKVWLPYFFLLFNLPFIYLAYRVIGKSLVVNMFISVIFFVGFLLFFDSHVPFEFRGETLEVIVFAGALLGSGLGFIIRAGGCLDGTEISAIILNRKKGFTVGQVVLFFNIFIFIGAGFIYGNWTLTLRSLLTYVVVVKVMDVVIVGLDETKSMTVISNKSKKIADVLMKEFNLGLTILYGKGGFSGKDQEILYLVVERIQLAEVKDQIYKLDPKAFIAVENIHEVLNGRLHIFKKNKIFKRKKT